MQGYPLKWPEGQKREHGTERARFKTSMAKASRGLLEEVRRLGGIYPTISTNIPVTKDGTPYSKFRKPDDPGAAIYFVLNGKPMAYGIDRWDRVEDNIQALKLSLEAIRGLDRWGISDATSNALNGMNALPAPKNNWRDVLVADDLEGAAQNYKKLRGKYHPDNQETADADKFHEVQTAWRECQLELIGTTRA